MDFQIGLLCITVAIISAIVIYVISMSTMKEKTYDEAMADLRKKTEEQFSQSRTAKEKLKDKKDKKKAGKKVKEKAATVASSADNEQSEVDGNKGHVAFAEQEEQVPSNNTLMKKKQQNKKKDKPILLNKTEQNIVSTENVPVIENNFEKTHPKDDFELKRRHSREEIKTTVTVANTANSPPLTPVKDQQSKKQAKGTGSANSSSGNKAVEQKAEKNQKQQNQQPKQQRQPKQDSSEKSTPVKQVPVVVDKGTSSVQGTFNEAIVVVEQKEVAKQQSAPSSGPPTPSYSDKLPASPSVKLSKKKKNELATLNQISGDHREVINVSLLLPLVRKAELSKSEMQLLIDFLLNKQQGISDGSAEWIEGRQDPVVKLKKQLAEKEKSLQDETEASAGLQARLKAIRAELNGEKHTVRTLEEALHSRQGEISKVALKLQQAVDEKQALAQQMQQMQQKLGEERLLARKMQEDSAQAQAEVITQRQQLEIHIAHFNESQLQQQETIASLEAQLGERIKQQDALTGQLQLLQERSAHLQDAAGQAQELHAQLEELQSVRANLEHIVTTAQFEKGRLQKEVNDLSEQLNHFRNENEKLNGAVKTFTKENSCLREANDRLSKQVSSANVEARQLRDENESLAAQVTASMERPATEGHENGDSNSYSEGKLSHNDNQDNVQKKELLLEELGSQLKSKEIQIESLTGQLNTHKTELLEQHRFVQTLKDEAEKHRQEAERLSKDLLQSKPQLEHPSFQEISSQLKSKEIQVESLTGQLNTYKTELLDQKRLVQTLKDDVEKHRQEAERLSKELLQHKSQMAQLVEQLDLQKDKNNDLRTKNWKVMDALATTEKLLQTKMTESDKLVSDAIRSAIEKTMSEQQASTVQLLQRVFPELVVPGSKNNSDWYEGLELALKNWKPQTDNNNSSFAELEKQNIQLQAMVTHYKTIIADTEGMLNRLQSHVEQEEGKWSEELQELQSQLEAVTRERDALQANNGSSIQTASNGYHIDDGCENDSA